MGRQTRSPLGEPRSKDSPDRQQATKWSSLVALLTIFVVFIYVAFVYDWYGEPSKVQGVVPVEDIIRFKTKYGDIRVVLRPDRAPQTVEHFKRLVDLHFYDDCVFYRAERGFVLQGGARQADGTIKKSPLPNINFEYGLANEKGTLAMARSASIDSANTEYFFNLVDNTQLLGPSGDNPGYTAFGEVVVGMSLLEQFAEADVTDQSGLRMLVAPIPVTLMRESM